MIDASEMPEEGKAKEDVDARLNRAKAVNPKRRLYVVDSPAGVIILGTPPRGMYLAYRAMASGEDKADAAKANDFLLTSCAVDPVAEEYTRPDGLLEQYPALAGSGDIYIAMSKATGLIKEERAKK